MPTHQSTPQTQPQAERSEQSERSEPAAEEQPAAADRQRLDAEAMQLLHRLHLEQHADALASPVLLGRLESVSEEELRTAGLPLLHARTVVAEAVKGAASDTHQQLSAKRRLVGWLQLGAAVLSACLSSVLILGTSLLEQNVAMGLSWAVVSFLAVRLRVIMGREASAELRVAAVAAYNCTQSPLSNDVEAGGGGAPDEACETGGLLAAGAARAVPGDGGAPQQHEPLIADNLAELDAIRRWAWLVSVWLVGWSVLLLFAAGHKVSIF
jgi:hypothetical protein